VGAGIRHRRRRRPPDRLRQQRGDFIAQAVQVEVLNRLRARYGTAYTDQNVVLTATHTHAGPGGFSENTMWNLTTLDFEAPVYEALVSGIVRAIGAADADLAPGAVDRRMSVLRFEHHGDAKVLGGRIVGFSGASRSFVVT
jgi:hypothetical protein